MSLMRSGNPALRAQTFEVDAAPGERVMTLEGAVAKTAFLLILCVAASASTWNLFASSPAAAFPWVIGGAIGGLVLGLITSFAKRASPYTAPLYAICEGLFLGGISAMYAARYQGIVLHAVGLTFGTLAALLAAYATRLIAPTENFKLGVAAATGGICLVYLVTFVLGFFGIAVPYIHGSGLIGIGFSAFVVAIAALNLVLDFDFIEQGAERGVPKHMEWYAAFGLLVTLVWLYLEILRLLAKLRDRR